MPFKLETWKATVRERLTEWRQRMQGFGVDSVYASLCAMTLWPVAEAAKGGDWSALMELGKVSASVGSNLVANRIQKWEDEVAAAQQLTVEAATDPALRAELDLLLEKLDIVPQALQELHEADRQWLIETLRTELSHLGNLPRFAGTLIIASHATVNVYSSPTRDFAEALTMYYQEVMKEGRYLSLRGLDVDASDATGTQQRLDLTQVYIDLLTTTRGALSEQERRQRKAPDPLADTALDVLGGREIGLLSVLGAVREHQHLVVQGDPGSGKSTFLRYFAMCLAAQSLEPNGTWLQRLTDWEPNEAELTPVLVTLREFARWLPDDVSEPEASHLWTFIKDRLEQKNLAAAVEPLLDRLEKGDAILLFDGLDEMPSQERGTIIRDAIQIFSERYDHCRVVVTCRTLSYADPDWQLNGFKSITLASFNKEQIDRFIAAWYAELARLGNILAESVEVMVRSLREAVRHPNLEQLAPNPMLLTVMALVHAHKGQLPDARVLLYKETVEILLWRWEQLKVSKKGELPHLHALLAQVGREAIDLESVLGRLAFEAHQAKGAANDKSVADIGETHLKQVIGELHPRNKHGIWSLQVIEVMKERAGLLVESKPGVYTFPHRTLQEYLAGAYLAAFREADFFRTVVNLVSDGPLWWNVALFAIGRLVYVNLDTTKPLFLVEELCPEQSGTTEAAWRQTWFAGEVLLEIGQTRAEANVLGKRLLKRVREHLVALLRGGHLSPVERARAGDTLARLGDPRFCADAWYLPDEPLLGFMEIPPGSFLMGSDPQRDSQAYKNEQPQHTVTLPRYYIARYPVTVAQFRAFVDDAKYKPPDNDCLQGLSNHPVAYVTWYDAMKYCEWLTKVLCEGDKTPEPLATLFREGGRVTLASEDEWEKAARGPLTGSEEGLIYPWGNEWRKDHANTDETGIGRPSAVGCFPQGASRSSGCLDMAGNVWEWTRSLWKENFEKSKFPYPYSLTGQKRENVSASDNVHRVLRGGASFNSQKHARCAIRRGRYLHFIGGDVGFRVVVLPKAL